MPRVGKALADANERASERQVPEQVSVHCVRWARIDYEPDVLRLYA